MDFISLPSKPDAPLAYKFNPSPQQDVPLLVFINGLGLPAASWTPTISQISEALRPHILVYDRFGQGATTSRDPTDSLPGKEPGYGHDLNSSVNDLHELLHAVAPSYVNSSPLVFVAASIGAHIARLYAAKHTGTVAGILLLDSNIANQEFTDFWPNPHSPDFKQEDVVSQDCTIEQYVESYVKLSKMFNSDVKNPEGLDRRNVKTLLPSPSSPKLQGPSGKGPWLIVAGHDPKYFAEDALLTLKIPLSLAKQYIQP